MAPFTGDDIPQALRTHVRKGIRLTYPQQGMTSEVAFVDGEAQIVIKRCRDPIYLTWLSRERDVLQVLAGTNLPVPRLLDYAEVDVGDRREAWLIMTRLQGAPVSSEVLRADPERRVELLRRVGELLNHLHATPVPHALIADAPWLDRKLAQARGNLSWCDGTPELLENLHRRRPAAVPEVLTHGDLTLDNVLCDPRGTMSLIDWSDGDRGDPRYDVALALQTKPEIELSPVELAAFFEGYGQIVVVDDDARRWFEALYEFF